MKNFDFSSSITSTSSICSETLGKRILDAAQTVVDIYATRGGRGMSNYYLQSLVSDIYTRALEKLSSYDSSRSKLESWISTIAKNCIIDSYKKEVGHAYRTVSIDSLSFLSSVSDRPDSNLESKESQKIITETISSLPEKQRSIIEQTISGAKPRHISKDTGETPKTVYDELRKARKSISKKLGEEFLNDHHIK